MILGLPRLTVRISRASNARGLPDIPSGGDPLMFSMWIRAIWFCVVAGVRREKM